LPSMRLNLVNCCPARTKIPRSIQTHMPSPTRYVVAKVVRNSGKAVLVAGLLFLPLAYTSRNHQKLIAEYTVQKEDFGIPGITKTYKARILNRGFVPVKIQVCAFVDDVGHPGRAPAGSIEELDGASGAWLDPWRNEGYRPSCEPVPLSVSRAELQDIWLWPGQSVECGSIALGGMDDMKGRSLRFVLYDSFQSAHRRAFVTQSFLIDEQRQTGSSAVRIQH